MDGTKLGPGQVLCSSTSKTYILLILHLCSLGDWREDEDCRTLSDPDRIASFVGWQEDDELESFWKKSSSERAINPSQRPLPTQHPVISGNEYDAITRIRNSDPSCWEAADYTTQGHRDLLTLKLPKPNLVTLKKEILSCFENQKEHNPRCGNHFKTSATKTWKLTCYETVYRTCDWKEFLIGSSTYSHIGKNCWKECLHARDRNYKRAANSLSQ